MSAALGGFEHACQVPFLTVDETQRQMEFMQLAVLSFQADANVAQMCRGKLGDGKLERASTFAHEIFERWREAGGGVEQKIQVQGLVT